MRGGDRTYAVAAMALGFVAAVGVVSMGLLGGARAGVRTTDLVEARPSLDGRGAGVRGRMASALASAHARPLAARLAEVEPEADAGDVLDLAKGNNSTGNATNATAEVEEAPCTSWRGCFHGGDKNYTSLPSDIRFECGGKDAADTCYRATRACVHSAEVSLANMYVVSPILGTEARGYAVCKCFISNGCKPGCNVAMYQRWSTKTALNCPSQPPIYHRSTGVYQYGDPNADYVPSSDLSFDYYPEYPNPAGHTYSVPWARNTWEREPAIGMYQRPLTNTYGKGYKTYSVSHGFHPFAGWGTHTRHDAVWEQGLQGTPQEDGQ